MSERPNHSDDRLESPYGTVLEQASYLATTIEAWCTNRLDYDPEDDTLVQELLTNPNINLTTLLSWTVECLGMYVARSAMRRSKFPRKHHPHYTDQALWVYHTLVHILVQSLIALVNSVRIEHHVRHPPAPSYAAILRGAALLLEHRAPGDECPQELKKELADLLNLRAQNRIE